MEDINLIVGLALFIAGLLAGFVDSVAGGGGLITLPVLLGLGLPPQVALGTNKFQSSFGSFSAAYNFVRQGRVRLRDTVPGIVFTLLGAASGAWAIQQIPNDFLKHVIPFLLLLVLLYTVFSPRLGAEDSQPKMGIQVFFLVFGLALGFYDGFFGPGTGSFWTVALMAGLGFNMAKATGYTKVMNFTSNIVSLGVFLLGNNVAYTAGVIMAVGQFLGARFGSGLVIKKGTGFIRPIFITMVLMTIVSLVYKTYFHI